MKRFGYEATNVMGEILPNALKAILDNTVCAKKGDDAASDWVIPVVCDLPRAYYNLVDTWERFKGIGRYADSNTWKVNSDYPDTCKDVFADGFLNGESIDDLENETDEE